MSVQCLFNPFDPAFIMNPYGNYRTLLAEAPMLQLPPNFLQRTSSDTDWCVSGYQHVSLALRDKRFVREWSNTSPSRHTEHTEDAPASDKTTVDTFFKGMNSMMLFRDPPSHTRLRSLMNKAFTPSAIESLHPLITNLVDYLLDSLHNRGQADLISDFAVPLPVMVIGELLGVPVEDRSLFKSWSLHIAKSMDATVVDPQVWTEAAEAYKDLSSYLKDIISERRRQPQEDLLSNFIQVQENGQRLDEQELLSSCILLLIAGHETTTHLIGNGFWTLHRYPNARSYWNDHPEVAARGVEEVLRFEPPVQRTMRYVSEPVRMGDVELQRGDSVYLLIGAANRDPSIFHSPDSFFITRHPNRHLSFAAGIHFCLGAPLARMEGQIALTRLVESNLIVDTDTPKWRNMTVFRGLEELPVCVG